MEARWIRLLSTVALGLACAAMASPASAQKPARPAAKPAAPPKPPPKPAPKTPKPKPAPKKSPEPTAPGDPAKPEPGRPAASTAHQVVERESRIEFDERMVRGQSAAGAIYLFQRSPSEFKSIVTVPEGFRQRTAELLAPRRGSQ